MKAIATIFGAGAAIPRTIFGVNLITTGTIKFILSNGEPKFGDMWHAYSLSSGPSIGDRNQTIIGGIAWTELFEVNKPSIYQYVGSLERWIGEIEIGTPFIGQRKCDVKFTAFDPSGQKKFNFHVSSVKCMGIQLGTATARGTLIRHFEHSHPTIQRQIKIGTIGR